MICIESSGSVWRDSCVLKSWNLHMSELISDAMSNIAINLHRFIFLWNRYINITVSVKYSYVQPTLLFIVARDAMKFAFKFVRFQQIRNCWIFSHTRRWIQTSRLHDRHHVSTPTGQRNNQMNQLNKCVLPDSLKGPKIILDMADHHLTKDGPFRILGSALTYLLFDFFGITFLRFLS